MTAAEEWLAAQVPGGRLRGQLIRPIKLVRVLRGPRRSLRLTSATGATGPAPGAARDQGWPGGRGLLCPAHADAAQVRVEVEQRADAEGLCHDVAERRPLRGLQAEQTENQLAQLRAVPVGDGRKGATHDLQHQRWQVRSLKGPLEAGQLIEDTAQGPDVTLLVVGLALTQFGGDVAWSTHHRVGLALAAKDLGDAKVTDLDDHAVFV